MTMWSSEEEGVCPSCRGTGTLREPCPQRVCRLRSAHFVFKELSSLQETDAPDAFDPRLGTFIDEYLLCQVLGRGGFGTVYSALGADGQRVALKMLSGGDGPIEAKPLRRFQGEARALQNIVHPNVVKVAGVGMVNGQPYMAMELVRGTTLHHWQRENAALGPPLGQVRQVLGQLLDGLQAAHSQSLVHRDIKPANVMLAYPLQGASTEPGQVKILDFGLVKDIADSNSTSAVVGTAAYMAPEQFHRRDIGPWTDVYAVGVLTAEIISGVRPFDGISPAVMVATKLTPGHDPLDGWRRNGAPEKLMRFIGRALALTPSARFQDAGAMRLELDAALDSLIEAPEDTEPQTLYAREETPTRRLLARFAATVSNRHRDDEDARFDAEYERERHLGGGMARVCLARDRSSGLRVVIKELPDQAPDEAQRLFQREVSVLAQIQSPHVVGYLDHSDRRLVMEYVDGLNLEEVLANCRRTGRPLPAGAAAQVVWGLTNGLADLHQVQSSARQPLVHRDVKPSNILLSRFGEVKVADLGVVQVDGADVTNRPGTLVYMAPEQLTGAPSDVRTDVYAAGLVLYEIITNATTLPPGMVGHAELVEARSTVPQAPSALRPGLSPDLDDLLLAALRPERTARPLDIRAWGRAVIEALDAAPDQPALAQVIDSLQPARMSDATATATLAPADGSDTDRDVEGSPEEPRRRPVAHFSSNFDVEAARHIDAPQSQEVSDSTAPESPRSRPRLRVAGPASLVVLAVVGTLVWWSLENQTQRPAMLTEHSVETASQAKTATAGLDAEATQTDATTGAEALETSDSAMDRNIQDSGPRDAATDTTILGIGDVREEADAAPESPEEAAKKPRPHTQTRRRGPRATPAKPVKGLAVKVTGKVRVVSASGGRFAPWVSKPLKPGDSIGITLGGPGVSMKLALSVSKSGRLRARGRSNQTDVVVACGGLPKSLPLALPVGRTCRVSRTSAGGKMSFKLSKVAR